MIQLIIFDFDDTLVLTEKAGFELENKVGHSLGFPPQSRKIHQKTWGRPLSDVASIRFPGINVQRFMARVGQEMKNLSERGLFDVVSKENLKTLEILKQKGVKLAVLTSRIKAEVDHIISRNHPLSSLIDNNNFFYRERITFRKPDPRVFQEIMKITDSSPDKSVYIGDSVTDAVCAKLSRLSFIASLESGLRKKDDFDTSLVDAFILKFPEVVKAIERIERGRKSPPDTSKINITLEVANQQISVPHDYFLKKIPEIRCVIEELEKAVEKS